MEEDGNITKKALSLASGTGPFRVLLRAGFQRHGDGSFGARHGDGSFVLTEQMMDDMIVTRKVIICPGRREKSQAREFTM